MAGRTPQCPICSGYHWPQQKCRDRCSECLGCHGYNASCNGPRAHQASGQPTTTNPSFPAGYPQQMNYSSPAVTGPGTGWFDPAYKRRQGASGPQMGTVSKGEKSKGGKRKRDMADKAEKTGPAEGPTNSQKTRREKRAKTANEAEEARQQLDQLKSQTAETARLNAELLALFKSKADPERVEVVMGLLEQAQSRRETAEKEQERLLKEYEEAVKKQQNLDEQLRQVQEQLRKVHEDQTSLRARMNEASLNTLAGANLAIRPAQPTSQDQALAAATAKTALEQPDEKMEENV